MRDLAATRDGDSVEIHFSLPQRTTDGLTLRPPIVSATLCRGLESAPCDPVRDKQNRPLAISEAGATARTVVWRDSLPPSLRSGPPRALLYRVQLNNNAGRNAGWSAAAYTLAGAAPAAVSGLQADPTPNGILLRWQPQVSASSQSAPAEVLLRRETISASPSPAKNKNSSQTVWLASHAETTGSIAAETLDTSAVDGVSYRYVAVRREQLQLRGRTLEMRSPPSAPVQITLRDIFPPPAPVGLNAAPFTESGHFAVDLVWEPVTAPDLAGYNVARQRIDAAGQPLGQTERLNPSLVMLPAYHDATADPAARYRYSVTAVSQKGNESQAAVVVVEPTRPE